jgi:O-antigen ligase
LRLYLCLTVIILCLAASVILSKFANPSGGPRIQIAELGNPILIVPNDIAFLAVIAPLSLALLIRRPLSTVGALASITLISSCVAIAVLQSRTATVALVSAIGSTAVFWRSGRLLAGLLAASVLLLVFAYLVDLGLAEKFIHKPAARLNVWSTAWSMFIDAPLFGHGPHTFGMFHQTHQGALPWAHNLYLQVLAEQGVLGLVPLILLLSYALMVTWKTRSCGSPDKRAIGGGAFGAVVAFCVAAVFELSFIREWGVIIWFVLLGIAANVRPAAAGKHERVSHNEI